MTADDPGLRIAKRRRHVATLRAAADRSERLAAEFRENADRIEASIDALEADR